MSELSRPSLHLPDSRFSDHPDSIAGQERRRCLEELDLTIRGQRPQLRLQTTIQTCPLPSTWREWDMLGGTDFRTQSADEHHVCARARRLVPISHRGLLTIEWQVAADDARHRPKSSHEAISEDPKFWPHHFHGEAIVDDHRVHIDVVRREKSGPGRFFEEYRIFVDDVLGGRGGRCGCSLGFGGRDLPAVAAIGKDAAIAIDEVSGVLCVELWAVRELHASNQPGSVDTQPKTTSSETGHTSTDVTRLVHHGRYPRRVKGEV